MSAFRSTARSRARLFTRIPTLSVAAMTMSAFGSGGCLRLGGIGLVGIVCGGISTPITKSNAGSRAGCKRFEGNGVVSGANSWAEHTARERKRMNCFILVFVTARLKYLNH